MDIHRSSATFGRSITNARFLLSALLVAGCVLGGCDKGDSQAARLAEIESQNSEREGHARIIRVRSDMVSIATAMSLYQLDNGRYPESLTALVDHYMRSAPVDPWGHPYVLQMPGDHGRAYDLISLGEDGKPGGEGPSADIRHSDQP